MKLHIDENKDAFRTLLESVNKETGHRRDVLEKDYYVVLLLQELAKKQEEGLPAYFKGGTALYKALKSTNRFSEDIDISVDTRNCSRTQNDKRLDKATKEYKSLRRRKDEGFSHKSEIVSMYEYDPIVVYDKSDTLQRFGRVKVEATSFTISEPIETLIIAPMIYEFTSPEFQRILETEYEIKPFGIQVMSFERIFVDKLFAAEAYTRKSNDIHKAFEAAKHIYDLAILSKHQRTVALYKDTELLSRLLRIRLTEEKERLDGIPGVKPIEFTFFEDAKANPNVLSSYSEMQRQYVLQDKDRIAFEDALDSLAFIKSQLTTNSSWQNAMPE